MNIRKIKNNNEVLRDYDSNAIINVDYNGLEQYKKQKYKNKQYEKTVEEINIIKTELNEIKLMLQHFLNQ